MRVAHEQKRSALVVTPCSTLKRLGLALDLARSASQPRIGAAGLDAFLRRYAPDAKPLPPEQGVNVSQAYDGKGGQKVGWKEAYLVRLGDPVSAL